MRLQNDKSFLEFRIYKHNDMVSYDIIFTENLASVTLAHIVIIHSSDFSCSLENLDSL